MIEWKTAEATSFHEEDRPGHIFFADGNTIDIVIYVDKSKRMKMCRLRVIRSDRKKVEVLRIKPQNDAITHDIWKLSPDQPYYEVSNLLKTGGTLALAKYLKVKPMGKPQLLEPSEASKTSMFPED